MKQKAVEGIEFRVEELTEQTRLERKSKQIRRSIQESKHLTNRKLKKR